jgi:superoxide dismutase
MDIQSIIVTTILSIFIPVITSALTIIVKRWVDEKIKDMENKKLQSLIKEGTDIILKSVDCVQQTYVDNIKSHDFFNEEAQKEAFIMARDRAMELLPAEIYAAIDSRYGSTEQFVETVIESYIAKNKKEKGL